jgi:hypothetical protein
VQLIEFVIQRSIVAISISVRLGGCKLVEELLLSRPVVGGIHRFTEV